LSIQQPSLSITKQMWESTCAMSKRRLWANPDVNQLVHNCQIAFLGRHAGSESAAVCLLKT
jgi:hypothetical protein